MLTPQTQSTALGRIAGVPVYLKREDLHSYGSHKGRSIPFMMDTAVRLGKKQFVISSSGNAALAAAIHIEQLKNKGIEGVTLTIFVGEKIPSAKLAPLLAHQNADITVTQTERPLQELKRLEEKGVYSLRQSTNSLALTGYNTLADELLVIENLRAVFIGTSSGTTAQALHERFIKRNKQIQIHIVQTTACHPLAEAFDEVREGPSEATAISDIVVLRRIPVDNAIRESEGGGWIVTDEDIHEAQTILSSEKVEATANGALAVAGLMRACGKELLFPGSVACIICGK